MTSAPTHDTPTHDVATAPVAGTAAATRCQMCPHDIAQHDSIGLRFCDATRTSALTRSCMCRV